ncbi:MAG: gamma-glutamylcyclotransferase [Leptospirales bacterium]|jgi:cation transport protein ChaC
MIDAESMRIFGYGSLLWNPGFDYEHKIPARLDGHHRAFCRLSVRHRGTPEKPGMVVGLKPGGSCDGICFSVSNRNRAAVLEYLDAREGGGYRRELVNVYAPVTPGPGASSRAESPGPGSDSRSPGANFTVLQAYTYLPEEGHPTYAPDLSEDETLALIAYGVGRSGRARDYLKELVHHLKLLQIQEPEFERMWRRIRDIE